ncbi:MAG: exodeoxyribonuclease VII small subunit [Oscillospiraceae bacterium]
MAEKKLSFEKSMERLEIIVKQLEKGEAQLSESLALYEEGTKLIVSCGKLLDEAEQKVLKLKKGDNGEPAEQAFEEGTPID